MSNVIACFRKITANMLEKLPKNPEQRITRSKNLLYEGDLLCHKCYMHYLRNPNKSRTTIKTKAVF